MRLPLTANVPSQGGYLVLSVGGIGVQEESSSYFDSHGNFRSNSDKQVLLGYNLMFGWDVPANANKDIHLLFALGGSYYETTFFSGTAAETELKGWLLAIDIGIGLDLLSPKAK